ncbi:MAG: site-2 protease family protein [Desulfuromonadales bacterium]|nr:site-2 protease family protein [Desulfuromonadales bacterium]
MEQIFVKISIMLVPALLAVTVHEVMHGFVADKLGDPTARLLGRLTLNPIKHLDPIGTAALLFFGFGWARPVPVNFANLRRTKHDMVWVALAGPLSNLALALACALVLRGLAFLVSATPIMETVIGASIEPLALMAAFGLYINLILAVFNLIPLPPLDGGRVMVGLLPPQPAAALARVEPFGFVIILFLIFFTKGWELVLSPIISFLVTLFAGPQAYVVHQAMSFLFAQG